MYIHTQVVALLKSVKNLKQHKYCTKGDGARAVCYTSILEYFAPLQVVI